MSRATFSNPNYSLAFGVDHAIGTFFTIYGPEVKGNRSLLANFSTQFGLDFNDPEEQITPSPFIMRLTAPFIEARGKNLAEEHIVGLAKALGLYSKELEQRVWELWD